MKEYRQSVLLSVVSDKEQYHVENAAYALCRIPLVQQLIRIYNKGNPLQIERCPLC